MRTRGSARRLEELDGIPVRIFDLDLTAAGTAQHLVAKVDASLLQGVDALRQVGDPKHDAVPSARFLGLAIREGARPGGPGAAEQNRHALQRHAGKGRRMRVIELETELLRIKR